MARKLRPADQASVYCVNIAAKLLRDALEMLKVADCPRAAEKVRRALKSTDGARRHANRRLAADGRGA